MAKKISKIKENLETKQKQFIFNSSVPRSGSQLFQCVLNQNPRFFASGTSGLIELVYSVKNQFSALPEIKSADWLEDRDLVLKNTLNGLMEGFYQDKDKEFICDKSRGWIYYYPLTSFALGYKPKLICMVRDLRAVFASFEKIYRKNPQSFHEVDQPNKMIGLTVGSRVNYWSKTPPIGLAIERLKDALFRGQGQDFIFIRYEDFIQNPQNEMNEFYESLGVEPFQHDFENIVSIAEDDRFHHISDLHTVKPKIEPLKFDHKEILGDAICKGIIEDYKWFYEAFYPEKI